MADVHAVKRHHVLAALEEFDELGGDEFLARHGFGRAKSYLLRQDGRTYDSKAVFGVAHRHATGVLLPAAEFSGGKAGAAKWLRDLGFDVTSPESESLELDPDRHWVDQSQVGTEAARSAWAEAAREVLLDTASRYHAVVTYQELAVEVQNATGISTNQLMHYWIGDVLGRVSAECARRGEPLLSSLCVNAAGSVGEGYAVAVRAAGDAVHGDADDHAASERFRCYQAFGATMPSDGGRPALTPKLQEQRSRARRAASAAQEARFCPTCNMALPATGICDNCD